MKGCIVVSSKEKTWNYHMQMLVTRKSLMQQPEGMDCRCAEIWFFDIWAHKKTNELLFPVNQACGTIASCIAVLFCRISYM